MKGRPPPRPPPPSPRPPLRHDRQPKEGPPRLALGDRRTCRHPNRARRSIGNLPPGLAIKRNRKAAHDLTFASIAFMVFPCQLTRMCLRQGVKKPSAKPAAQTGKDFGRLGDDPITICRGSRGYVFRAFSASGWQPESAGAPVWKEYDIAAFKEALKTLNQFRLKTEERSDTQRNLEGFLAHLLGGKLSGWTAPKNEAGDEGTLPPRLNPDLLQLAFDLEHEMTLMLNESVLGERRILHLGDHLPRTARGPGRFPRAALRGLKEIVLGWEKVLEKLGMDCAEDALAQVVKKDHQRAEGNKTSIGSVPLFLTLCRPAYRPLWNARSLDSNTSMTMRRRGCGAPVRSWNGLRLSMTR